MDIREVLLLEHSKHNTLRIVEYIGSDKSRFKELIDIFFEGQYRLTQRASWAITGCSETSPDLIKPYIKQFIAALDNTGEHPAVRRNIVRSFQFFDLPERFKGEIYSRSLDMIADPTEAVAVRAFAITVAQRIANDNEDLLNELKLVVSESTAHGTTPAINARAKMLMKKRKR